MAINDPARAFVIMPFSPAFEPVYSLFIREALTEAGFDVFRADDIRSQRNILTDIVESIATSDLVVADLTDENPNVFYELGVAHALQKPVLLLTQSIDDVPFDLRSYRLLSYSTHFAEITEARAMLKSYGEGFRSGTVLFGSPVSDFLSSHREGLVPVRQHPTVLDGTRASGAPATATPDDRGLLDHLEDLNAGYAELVRIIESVTAETVAIGEVTEETSAEIQRVMQQQSEGSVSYVRKLARKLADRLSRFSAHLSQSNSEYRAIAVSTDNSLEFLVSFQADASSEDKSDLERQLAELHTMLLSAVRGRDAYRGLAHSMESVPKLERHLTRALADASNEVQQMADNIDQTIASFQRAIEIGRRTIEM